MRKPDIFCNVVARAAGVEVSASSEWNGCFLVCDMQGESVRSQQRMQMTTRRCPMVSLLDGMSSHLDGLEQSSEKKAIKSQLKTVFFPFHRWCLKTHIKYASTLSGAYPQVLKCCRHQDSPTGTIVAAFPSHVCKLNPQEKLLEAEKGRAAADRAGV